MNPGKQFIKVLVSARLLQSFVIQCSALFHIFLQNIRSLDSEQCTYMGLHPTVHRYNGILIILTYLILSFCRYALDPLPLKNE